MKPTQKPKKSTFFFFFFFKERKFWVREFRRQRWLRENMFTLFLFPFDYFHLRFFSYQALCVFSATKQKRKLPGKSISLALSSPSSSPTEFSASNGGFFSWNRGLAMFGNGCEGVPRPDSGVSEASSGFLVLVGKF